MSAGRPRVALCVITKNEEAHIGECLASVTSVPGLVDEIVVLDSGSDDRTVAIAEAAGARVETHPFDGYIEQKNRAISLAESEWILAVDADERVSPELGAEMLEALAAPDLPAGFSMPRLTRYLGRWIRHGRWYPDRKVRLFSKARARWGGRNPHDHVRVDGPVRALRGDLLHYSYSSLADHARQVDSFTTIMAAEMRAEGRRGAFWRLLVHPPFTFVKGYLLQLGFLDGRAGFVVAVMGAYYVFLKYAKLWELARGGGDG
jgi:glycosyltransferase involved in cell wall biosynthesis